MGSVSDTLPSFGDALYENPILALRMNEGIAAGKPLALKGELQLLFHLLFEYICALIPDLHGAGAILSLRITPAKPI